MPSNLAISSHSHLPDHLGDFSFVSAWDLYQISLASAITVIGSSEDPEACLRSKCAREGGRGGEGESYSVASSAFSTSYSVVLERGSQ